MAPKDVSLINERDEVLALLQRLAAAAPPTGADGPSTEFEGLEVSDLRSLVEFASRDARSGGKTAPGKQKVRDNARARCGALARSTHRRGFRPPSSATLS
jgi:hypothetical protein